MDPSVKSAIIMATAVMPAPLVPILYRLWKRRG
jgi:hypothetical protein